MCEKHLKLVKSISYNSWFLAENVGNLYFAFVIKNAYAFKRCEYDFVSLECIIMYWYERRQSLFPMEWRGALVFK